MAFKDEKIYNGMKELVKKSLTILDRSRFEYIEDFNIEVNLKNIPPISFLQNDKIRRQISLKIEEIEKTKEFAYTCDLVNKIPTFQSDFKWDDLSHFLIAYCNLKKDLDFDEAIFNGLYKRFEEKLYGKNYTMALCPLKKFYLETDELVLDDGIKIRRISQGELSFINKEMAGNTLKNLDDIQFTIEYTYDENEFRKPRDADDWNWSAWQNATAICEEKFIKIVALLRIFKEKDGDFYNPLENLQVPFWGTVPKGIHFNLCDRRIPEDRNYILKSEEAEDFTEFYRKSLRFTGDDRRMFIALERFNLAYEKKRFVDNIIDYVIAFEALFVNSKRIGMEIGLKSGFLVGDSKEKITEIYKFMRDLYGLRSTIVHGDEIKIPMKIGKEDYYSDYRLRSDIKEIFRKIIRCCFDEGRTEDREETFAIIEDELKSGENKDKSGEEMVKLIYDKIQTKKEAPGVQPEHESIGA